MLDRGMSSFPSNVGLRPTVYLHGIQHSMQNDPTTVDAFTNAASADEATMIANTVDPTDILK